MLEKIRAKKPNERTLGEVMLVVLLTGGMWVLCCAMGCVGWIGALVTVAKYRGDPSIWLVMMLVATLCGLVAHSVGEFMREG